MLQCYVKKNIFILYIFFIFYNTNAYENIPLSTLSVSTLPNLLEQPYTQKYIQLFYQNKNVLVTGGCGFIGSHIVEKLVSLGAHVTIIDNLSTGSSKNILSVTNKINFIQSSIEDRNIVQKACVNQNIIIHLAAFVSVPESVINPIKCYKINVNGAKNILKAAVQNHITNVVFASSAAVYGNKEGLCSETDTPAPTSPYAISKLVGEHYCKYYAKKHASFLSTVCLRYFNVYGDRQNPNGHYAAVWAKFKYNLINGLPITIYGDGFQTRDFVPVATIVNATLYAGTLKNMCGEVFNVCTQTQTSINDVLERCIKDTELKPTTVIFQAMRPGDIIHSVGTCEKIKNILCNIIL